MKNSFKLQFIFKENDFVIHYYINDCKTLTMNALKTLNLTNPGTTISFDMTFHDSVSLYGLPLRMSELSLKPTDKESAYRLFNLDCAEHIPGNPQSLYGSIPIVHSLNTKKSVSSILYHNPSDTWVDIKHNDMEKSLNFISEGGIVNLYIYSDTDLNRIFYKQMTKY